MKKTDKIRIRNRAWKIAWDENKNRYTMQELALALNASLPTFFRSVSGKSGRRLPEENKKK